MPEDNANRDRIRALVRDVLDNVPVADAGAHSASSDGPVTRFIDTAPSIKHEDSHTVSRDESSKKVITEDDVRGLEPGAVLRIAEGARLTPLAADIVRERNIGLVRRPSRRGSSAAKLIAVGADHGGFKMKQELKAFLAEAGHRIHDFGTDSEDAVDYPDFAHAVARVRRRSAARKGAAYKPAVEARRHRAFQESPDKDG